MNQLKYFFKINFTFTYFFLGICVILFLLSWVPSLLTSGSFEADPITLVKLGANFGTLVSSGEYWRLLSANFLHGSILHLVFNMYALLNIGTFVESYFSRRKFFVIFIITGFIATLTSFVFNSGFSVGASGAIFGLLGLLLAQSVKRKNYYSELPIDKRQLIGIILINLVFGFAIPGIDNFAHIGGLISGFLLGLIVRHANAEVESKANTLIQNVLLGIAIVISVYGVIGFVLNIFSH